MHGAQKRKLAAKKRILRRLVQPTTTPQRRKLLQTGGFLPLLPLLISAVAGITGAAKGAGAF